MGSAKDLVVKPISSSDANRMVKAFHYSGKVVNNSQLHLGVFLNGRCGGAMQFGPSLDKRKIQGLVSGTLWNEFIELNRMAFADWLPRNSESRCIGYAMRWIRKTYPHIKWVISFADGTQCGDGTIYRASGFVLTGIKENNQIWVAPSGERFNDTSIRPGIGGERERERAKRVLSNVAPGRTKQTRASQGGEVGAETERQNDRTTERQKISRTTMTKANNILDTGASSMKAYKAAGWKPLPGFQLRYVFFIDPTASERLTVPVLPFSEIARRGAGMYRGKTRAGSADSGTSPDQGGRGGATPTPALSDHDNAPKE
jgi:hypothetical protein